MNLYQPDGTTVVLGATATSSRVALPTTNGVLRIFVESDALVFVAFGGDAVEAAIPVSGNPGAMPLAFGRETGLTPPGKASQMAAICPAGKTAKVYITAGAGL